MYGLWLASLLLSLGAEAAAGTAPELLGIDTAGHAVKLSAQHGKLVVVAFWASWCGSCLRELPALEGIQQRVGRERLAIYAINHGETQQRWERIRTVFKGTGIQLLRDPGERSSEAFGVEEIPQLYVIDTDGRIAHRHAGYDDDTLDQLLAELNALLVQKPDRVPASR